jgi:hypothetical protein
VYVGIWDTFRFLATNSSENLKTPELLCVDPGLGKHVVVCGVHAGSYINEDLGSLMMEAGLTPSSKTVASSTKSLSFVKPLTPLTASNRKAAAADAGPKSAPALAPVVSPAIAGRPSGLSRAISGVEEPRATFFT